MYLSKLVYNYMNNFDTLVNQIIINKEGNEIEKRPSQYRLIYKLYE